MTHYTNIKMWISEDQKDKIKKAFESNSKSITIRFKFSDPYGEDVIALTKWQVDRLVEAYEEKKGITIRISKTQIIPQHENRRRIFTSVSRIDSILTGTVLPALWVEALSGLASTGVHKLIGNGMYLKEGSDVCRIETDGEGLYLGPASGEGFETVGNGLYLMTQGRLYDGRELILGPTVHLKYRHSWYDFVILLSKIKILDTLQNGNWWNWW